jgi:hypothetical protein
VPFAGPDEVLLADALLNGASPPPNAKNPHHESEELPSAGSFWHVSTKVRHRTTRPALAIRSMAGELRCLGEGRGGLQELAAQRAGDRHSRALIRTLARSSLT